MYEPLLTKDEYRKRLTSEMYEHIESIDSGLTRFKLKFYARNENKLTQMDKTDKPLQQNTKIKATNSTFRKTITDF